ncbi:MAG: hypothetical protein Q9167_005931 [Letrouitia subvulpina]
MQFTSLLAFASALAAANACTQCPHPGTFTGKLSLYTTPQSAYCGINTIPANAVAASIPASFFNPPDESPCDAPINVTNPSTKKTIKAYVVDKSTSSTGNNLRLTTNGLAALSPGEILKHSMMLAVQ